MDSLKIGEYSGDEHNALLFFNQLKETYASDRQPYEHSWRQAIAAVYGLQVGLDKLDRAYNGLALIESPIMNWKVNGIVSRINRILFNVQPFGRIEDGLVSGTQKKNIVDLWNSFIFDYQMEEIGFKQAYKLFQKNKCIQGTAFAHVSQEYEEEEFSYFNDDEKEKIKVKDNPCFRNLLITEFYSDVSKENINDSQACIYSRSVSMEELKRNEKHQVTEVYELIEPELDGNGNIISEKVIGEEEVKKERGLYHNLHLLEMGASNITPEQQNYVEWLGLTKGETNDFKRALKDTRKTGFVLIDECYGLFPLDGKVQEVLCVIANGTGVIRLEPTPFRHKKFKRPFIRGVYKPIPNCLYGESNVIQGLNLLQELNASRSQASDAKTFSVFPMTYIDLTKSTLNKWDRQIRPGAVIEGNGPMGIDFLAQPYLAQVAINDSMLIQRDLDQLWSLSPVQEGTSDNRLIPQTARGTQQVIAQNDMPLNDIIDNAIENELKPFIEIIYERNIQFKTVDDLKKVWTEDQIKEAGFQVQKNLDNELIILNNNGEEVSMKELVSNVSIKILGNLELSNEISHQMGWERYGQMAMQLPPLARRTDWKFYGEKLLESYGIKDDSEGLWFSDEVVAQIDQEQQNANQQALGQQAEMAEKMRVSGKEDYKFKIETDTESEVVKDQARAAMEMMKNSHEVMIEKVSGEKVA